jgi:gliding motility-associated-like protein
VQLDGKVTIAGGGTWTTAGDGTFIPSATQLNATYVPGATDPVKGSVVLTLSANNPGVCFTPSGSLTVTFIPPPTVYAGGTRFVLVGSTITLYPTVSDGNVHYLWSPNIDINNDTLKNPVITGDINRVYTLTVTDTRGCVAQDTALIKVSPIIKINNTFTPNGDGVNDYWDIIGLIAYQEATVDIFDRWGQKVFHSLGYPKPWDGTFNGKPVPIGVYYYLINTHFNGQVLSGYVTVIR